MTGTCKVHFHLYFDLGTMKHIIMTKSLIFWFDELPELLLDDDIFLRCDAWLDF